MRRSFGHVLRDARKERKISQVLLAFEAKLDRAYIGKLERNESQPTLATVFAIAKALNIRASEMIARMER